MKITIETDALGTILAKKIVDKISEVSRDNATRIREDIQDYADGKALDDMKGLLAELERIIFDCREAEKSIYKRMT